MKFNEYKIASDIYPLENSEYVLFEDACETCQTPLWEDHVTAKGKESENTRQFNPVSDQQTMCTTSKAGLTISTWQNANEVIHTNNQPPILEDHTTQMEDIILIGNNNAEEESLEINPTINEPNLAISQEIHPNFITTNSLPSINIDNYTILANVFLKTEKTVEYIKLLLLCKQRLAVTQEQPVFDFLDKQIRDATFFRKYRGSEQDKTAHVSYFEEAVGIQIEEYKKKNEVQFYIGRENIKLIRRNVRILLAWKYLRSRNFDIMDGNKIANCIIHIIWFIFDREKRSKKEDLSYNKIREFCKSNATLKLRQLPENAQKLSQDIIKAAPYPIPIQDRSTIRNIVNYLRKSYNFDKLPDSYFMQRPELPENCQNLRQEVKNEFPIRDTNRLTALNSIRYNLKRFYKVPSRLPDSYFDLPPKKQQQTSYSKPALPTNSTDISLDCEKYLPWKRGGTPDYSFRDLLRDTG